MTANYLKQLDADDVTVNGIVYHVFPFPAFKAANLTGELAAVIVPLVSALAGLLNGEGTGKSITDIEIEKAAPEIGAAFQSISGDKLESLLRKLLIQYQNVSVELPEEEAQWLTEDLSNVLFGGNTQDLFILAFQVIKVNYSGFFGKYGSQFGAAANLLKKKATI